jgi:hypothetical protein
VTYAGEAFKGVGMKKIGEACASSILGIIATGDASIKAASRGKDVMHVDHTGFSILGLYGKHCTVAYGAGGAAPAAAAE